MALIQQPGEPGSKFSTTTISFFLDDQFRIKGQADFSTLHLLFTLLVLIAFEGSRLSSTPGKMLFRLQVSDANDGAPGLRKAVIRNLLKNFYLTPAIIMALVVSKGSLYLDATQVQALYFNENLTLKPFSLIWHSYNATALLWIAAGMAAINLLIILSILFPWQDKGRAIYDRLAGTMVVSRH